MSKVLNSNLCGLADAHTLAGLQNVDWLLLDRQLGLLCKLLTGLTLRSRQLLDAKSLGELLDQLHALIGRTSLPDSDRALLENLNLEDLESLRLLRPTLSGLMPLMLLLDPDLFPTSERELSSLLG